MPKQSLRSFAVRVLLVCLIAVAALLGQASKEGSAVPALPADIPANAERYSMLMMGNLAGQQAVWTATDGTVHMFFQFNDRGRGPKTTSILKLDASGIPLSETVTGNDYLKSSVNENYNLDAGCPSPVTFILEERYHLSAVISGGSSLPWEYSWKARDFFKV